MKKLDQITPEQWQGVSQFNQTILEDFLTNSAELSPKTRKAYESNLRIWFVWVMMNLNNKNQTDIKPIEYKKFQNWMVNRGCSSSDINNKRAAISSLNGYIEVYCSDEFPMFRNFINKSIKRPAKNVVNEKEPLTKAEFAHLISVLTEMGEWQKIAYLLFTFEAGCRRAESRQLTKDAVDIKPTLRHKTTVDENGVEHDEEIRVYYTKPIRCKGAGAIGKVRRLVFGDDAMSALKKWVAERGDDDCPYMFVANYGGKVKQVSETTFNTWFTGLFSSIVGRPIHPHTLRSSRATQAVVEDGKDVEAVKQLLGHEDQSTTLNYYIVKKDDDEIDSLF